MKKVLLVSLACLALMPVALSQEPVGRVDVVQAMLQRSRLLEDVQVEIPAMLWREYLRDRAGQRPPADPAPVAMIADLGLYRIGVDDKHKATLNVTVRLRIFSPQQCRNVAVLSARRAWENVSVNGKGAKLATRDGWLRFSPAEPGVYEITASSPLPDAAPRRDNTIKLPTPKTVRTLVEFDSPTAWSVTATGATGRLVGLADEGTHGQFALAAKGPVEVRYGPVRVERDRPARYRLSGNVAWNLDAGRQQIVARILVRILGGRTDKLVLSLPDGAERTAITGPDIRETRINGRQAIVFLRGAIAEQTSLRLQYDLPAGKGTIKRFAAPTIRDGSWSGGTLTVTHTLGGSELLDDSTQGLDAVDLWQIPPEAAALLAGPPAMTYRITGRDFSASVEVLDLGEFALRESLVDLAHYEVSLTRSGAMICKVRYEIRNRTKQFLHLTLPAGAKVLLASVNEKPRPLTPVAAGPGSPSPANDEYILPLVRSKASIKGLVSFPVEVVYVHQVPALQRRGEVALPLPRVDLPIAYAWSELYAPPEMQVSRWAGPLRPVQAYSNETAVAQLGYGSGQLAEGFAARSRMTPGERLEQPWAQPRGTGLPTAGVIAGAEIEPLPADAPSNKPDGATYGAQSLAKNYWRAGKDHYDRGEYDKASEAFGNVKKLAPKSVEARNAARLQSNIDLIAGKLSLKGRSQRVAGAKVRSKIAADNRRLAEKQQTYLVKSAQAAQEGRYEEAARQYKAAESLREALVSRGEDAGRQSVVLAKGKAEVAVAEQQLKAQAKSLRERYQTFRAEGKFDLAQKELRRLRDLGEGDEELSKEMEELAVLRARHHARDATASPAPRQPSSETPAKDTYGVAVRPDPTRITRIRTRRSRSLKPTPPTDQAGKPRAPSVTFAAGSGKGVATVATIDLPEIHLKSPDVDGPSEGISDDLDTDEESAGGMAGGEDDSDTFVMNGHPAGQARARHAAFQREERASAKRIAALRAKKVAALRDWAGKLIAEQRYEQAVQIHEEIVALDPKDTSAAGTIDALKQFIHMRQSGRGMDRSVAIGRKLQLLTGRRKALLAIPAAEAPWHESLAFPDSRKGIPDRRRPAGADEDLEGDDYGYSAESMDGGRRRETITRVYDVSDLIAGVQDVAGPRLDVAEAATEKGDEEDSSAKEKLIADLTKTITSTMWSARTGTGTIRQQGGQLIITQTAEGHKELMSLLSQLREARGPQVETGANIAQQRAAIRFETTTELVIDRTSVRADGGVFVSGRDVDTHFQLESTVVDDDKKEQSRKFDKFYSLNYGWRDGRRGGKRTAEEVAQRARFNLGQKVGVSSLNVGVTAAVARGLNVKFVQGRNDLRYAIVDEAQVRTLRQLASKGPAGATNENPRNQETIVGTDALLSNAMKLNVTYARDRGNRLDILDNPIELSQEKYILIDNYGYLTAVKAGAMQHWTAVTVFEPLAEIPQTIDVPRAGQLVKLEKTLVDPADRLEIRATYRLTPGQ
ncbi:MAG TPA: hypothetical protein ENH80_00310 [Phycisphaerae bacterium]|nr:hypothetical protein [Phycisphaerae bacterium]HDZ42363.1 hypothetical protein [Phycisphaerae bacterium]